MASADLAVGLIGLFSVCLEGYRLISSAEGYARDALVLRTQLCIEEQRLKNWGHVWGFVPSDHYRPESRRRLYHQHVGNMGCAALVEEMLKRIGMLLEEAEKLGAKYGLVPAAGLNTMAERLAVDLPTHRTGSAPLPSAGRNPGLLRKALWAIVDKGAFKSLVDDLRVFNDGLANLLPPQTQEFLARATVLAIQGRAPLELINESSQRYPGLQEASDWALRVRDMFNTTATAVTSQNITKHRSYLSPSSTKSSRYRATYTPEDSTLDPVDVIVEWQPWLRSEDASAARIKSLVRLLQFHRPAELRLLDCYGFADEHKNERSRFGLLYHAPPPDPLSSSLHGGACDVKSLHSLLQTHEKVNAPPLDSRFRLAKLLCRTVLLYHASNWIHHDFRSGNVIFAVQPPMAAFSQSGDPNSEHIFRKCDLSCPFITGFGFARPDAQDECSRALESAKSSRSILEDVKRYWSPRYMDTVDGQESKRFQQVHDVYSLGCVLLEIGMWKPLDALRWKKEYTDDHGKWHTRLRRECQERLTGACGRRYAAIVERCLMWDQDCAPQPIVVGGSAADLQRLCWEVVQGLEELSV